MRHALSSALLLCAIAAAPAAFAATLATPDFQASFSFLGTDYGPFNGVAGTPGGCDLFGDAGGCDLDSGPFEPRLLIDWVDADSFDLFFEAGSGFGPAEEIFVDVALGGLQYLVGAVAVPITGFALNFAASDIAGFLASEDNPTGTFFNAPSVGFSATGVTATIGLSGQLEGDGPRLRFDLTAGSDVAPVPLPAAAGLLVGGLAALGLAGRRKRRTA